MAAVTNIPVGSTQILQDNGSYNNQLIWDTQSVQSKMKNKQLAILSIVIAVIAYWKWCPRTNRTDLVVTISSGNLRGKDNGFYLSFESIPYAEAPIGKLRFEAPVPYQQKWKTEFDGTQKSKPCLQWNQFGEGGHSLTGVEDCLTINVYKPKTNLNKYAVMVYLHGGCFMFGDVNLYDVDLLMKNGNIMVVKVVYRLGPLGFLSTEDENIAGNFGLKDQQLALEWVKENIAQFGGDPDKIMLTGFSAGAASTHLQLLNPKLQSIAKSAVSFSGTALNPWVITKNARRNAFKVAKLLKCPDAKDSLEIKKCLQTKYAGDIVSSVKHFLTFGYNPFTTFGPVVEHKEAHRPFMTQHPRDIIKSGEFSHIPWLAAYTKEDGGYNAAEVLRINPKTGKEYIYDFNDQWLELAPLNLFLENVHDRPKEYAMKLREMYMGEKEFSVENYLRVQEIHTDIVFKNGTLESLDLHRLHGGNTPVYGYVYDNPADYFVGYVLTERKDIEFGTTHMDDVSLFLKYPGRSAYRPDEVAISDKFIKMLVDFIETGLLSFGDCKFEENSAKSKELKILSIERYGCKSIAAP